MSIEALPSYNSPQTILVCGMSRSGTTLLVTMLDSHPEIAMGYEMLPTGISDLQHAALTIESALQVVSGAKEVESWLKERNESELGRYVRQADRASISPELLPRIILNIDDEIKDRSELALRYALSIGVVELKRQHERARFRGFKLNAPSIELFDEFGDDVKYLFIIRDPRDIYASHVANNFNRDIKHVCKAWTQYLKRFQKFSENAPERTMLIRYEDVVRRIDEHVTSIGEFLGISDPTPIRNFFDSKASVHSAGHSNAKSLKQDVFDTSVGRWFNDLNADEVQQIETNCGSLMRSHGYLPVAMNNLVKISGGWGIKNHSFLKKRTKLAQRKVYYRDNYADLVQPWVEGRTNLTWGEAATGVDALTEEILILRHDVDHDFETALKMGRWEHEHGLRATYCILHTSWYYGTLTNDGVITRNREMLECCKDLQSMGHEINLHNNFVVESLRTGFNPIDMMRCELAFLRWNGIKVHGTSTHGDGLCRELDFRNFELFSECVYPSRGGPRTIEKDGIHVDIGFTSMSTLDLDYEAYDLPRDYYITDSGGNLRVRKNTRGRAGQRRKELVSPPKYKHIIGILTHPIWWNFDVDAPADCTFSIPLPEEAEPAI